MTQPTLYQCVIAPNRGLPVGPEMAITSEALAAMFDFLISRPVEAGGMLVGPYNKAGITHFFPDHEGSAKATHTMYSPDAKTLNSMLRQLDKLQLEIKGQAHSHPGRGPTFPSGEAAYGKGDHGYARKYFDENEAALYYAFPILTFGNQVVTISPFTFLRGKNGAPPTLCWSPVRVTEQGGFRECHYNPEWLLRIESEAEAKGDSFAEVAGNDEVGKEVCDEETVPAH